jgi:hypothetical protein
MRVVHGLKGVVASVDTELEFGNRVVVAGYPEYTFRSSSAKC